MSVFIPAPAKDAFVASHLIKKNFADAESLFVGSTTGSTAVFRIFMKFDVNQVPKNSLISSAILHLFVKRNDYAQIAKTFDIHRLTRRFEEDEITWRKQPAYDAAIISSAEVRNENGIFVAWDITHILQRWCSGEVKNRGLLLKARDEAQPSLLAFDSRESASMDRRPNITVNLQEPAQSFSLSAHFFFADVEKSLVSGDDYLYTFPRDVSTVFFHTFFIQNKGANPVTVVAQISPDNTSSTWLDDSAVSIVNPGENSAITSTHLAKWTRLAYKSTNPGNATSLNVWFQSET